MYQTALESHSDKLYQTNAIHPISHDVKLVSTGKFVRSPMIFWDYKSQTDPNNIQNVLVTATTINKKYFYTEVKINAGYYFLRDG